MRVGRVALIALSVLVFFGCAVAPTVITNSKDETVSLVYGYIDMSDGVKATFLNSSKVSYVNLKQIDPVIDKPVKLCGVSNGAFWNDRLSAGIYQVLEFGRYERTPVVNITRRYPLPEFTKNITAFKVSKPGLYYVGTFKLVEEYDEKMGYQFTVVETGKPREKEVLEILLPLSEGTKWEALIQKRIKELK
ncbi:MAG: hypothetical protein OEV59_00295 [Deltaproteobacteria bacterium]|nr:hypothetical protein [Deltaproteobacteria bacterium]